MTDESACEVELYANNHVFLTLGRVREAYLNMEIDKHEAINAAGAWLTVGVILSKLNRKSPILFLRIQ